MFMFEGKRYRQHCNRICWPIWRCATSSAGQYEDRQEAMSANMKHSINRGCNLTLSSTNKQHCTSLNKSALKWLCAKPLSTWPSERMEGKVNRNLTPLTALLTSAALQTMCCNFTIIFSLPSSNRTASISSCPARSSVDNNLLKILASQL